MTSGRGADQADLEERLRGSEAERERLLALLEAERRRCAELEAQGRLFQTLVDTSTDNIVRYDREHRHLFLSASAVATSGRPVEWWLGKTHRELGWPVEVAVPIEAGIDRAVATGQPQTVEVSADMPTGRRTFEFRMGPELVDGRVESVIAVVRDVTEWREAVAERIALLENADRMKDEFLGVISHELRTPINAIMGFASIMQDGIGGPLTEAQQDYLRKVMAGSERLLGLVGDLLDIARIQAGKLSVQLQPSDLPPMVADVLANLAPLAAGHRVALVDEVPEALSAVLADPARTVQVLTNLVGNAIKFTPAHGTITVRACEAGGHVRCEVVDTGVGIAPEDRPKLFQRFSQVDMSHTRRAGGTGLGLSITKALVLAQGGEIGVESTPGLGSTFWFTVPVAKS